MESTIAVIQYRSHPNAELGGSILALLGSGSIARSRDGHVAASIGHSESSRDAGSAALLADDGGERAIE
jgi:hypothetical protein